MAFGTKPGPEGTVPSITPVMIMALSSRVGLKDGRTVGTTLGNKFGLSDDPDGFALGRSDDPDGLSLGVELGAALGRSDDPEKVDKPSVVYLHD